MITIQATTRNLKTNLAEIRGNDSMPAVFYGAGHTSTPITVGTKEFIKALKAAGESTTVTLDINGKKVSTLIHDVQFDAIHGTPTHADFLVVDENKAVHVSVPLEFVGVAPAVKTGLGMLVKVMHEIEISALPKDLPHAINVDITSLATTDDQITAAMLTLPKGVTLITHETEIVASIGTAKEEVESAPIDLSKIEVEKKGKKDEEAATE